MPNISCQVTAISSLSQSVKKVCLQPKQDIFYQPGQYLQVVMGENDKRPFSIANPPSKTGEIELHIGADPSNQYAWQVIQAMQNDENIEIDGIHGRAYWHRENVHPVVLMAGGTGFSYTNAILQALLKETFKGPIFLYWGGKTIEDLYAFDELKALEGQHKNFKFVPVIEETDSTWTGKTGWVHKAVLEDFVSLHDYQVYLAGRFEMAGIAREDFQRKGLQLSNLFGDAYEFI